MEQRLANIWRMSVNEKKFIENALLSDHRVDGRRPFDYRRLSLKFGSDDGTAEVQLGQTHVMGFVTAQLVQPYRDRPNEGTFSIFTEFSPMADPSFEPGRPGEAAVELGRIIDRGLRESRAVDMESLCVLAGKLVWAIRVDLHILDNGGNLVDAANIAAVAALLTFRRPECSLGGEDTQSVIIHQPEVIDPTYKEEIIMGGRMTVTMNTNEDVCAIQKPGGQGVKQSEIMRCLRLASQKATDITDKIKKAVEAYDLERAQRKIRRHSSSSAQAACGADIKMSKQVVDVTQKKIDGFKIQSKDPMNQEEVESDTDLENSNTRGENNSFQQVDEIHGKMKSVNLFTGRPSSWHPYGKGITSLSTCTSSVALSAPRAMEAEKKDTVALERPNESKLEKPSVEATVDDSHTKEMSASVQQVNQKKSLKDAVKVKSRKKKKVASTMVGE
ncbi:exosome complex component RRP45A isoform X2 [Amborella trichopoda]|uniref:exosome complex component RRP45A isoform X2 n=1 Tax=Amborella trichopoda TaxID=13333 RepID=UPI0009BCFF67|nr:exosome complex component RRP45A isoform X2 [Amborella trichopoda]|eukprot:XP_020531561.1 exosome complex component RRP45A isoform X2 [Amborella trichopoda]